MTDKSDAGDGLPEVDDDLKDFGPRRFSISTGDEIVVGDISDSTAIAIGPGAQVVWGTIYHYIEGPKPNVPYMAPKLPAPYVQRGELIELAALVKLGGDRSQITVLQGMAGVGKTTLAIALCHDKNIIESFPHGILWATLGLMDDEDGGKGDSRSRVAEAQQAWIKALSDDSLGEVTSLEVRAAWLRGMLYDKNCLLVIDEVWRDTGLDHLLVGGEQCATLVITREIHISQNIDGNLLTLGTLKQDEALAYFKRSIDIYRKLGNKTGEAEALTNIGNIYRQLGELDAALEIYQQSLDIDRMVGHRVGEATVLNNIGLIYQRGGELDEALAHYQESLAIDREVGNRAGEAAALSNIGLIYQQRGELAAALEHYQQSLHTSREVGDRAGEAAKLSNIGLVYQQRGQLETALEYYQQSLHINREVGDRAGEVVALNNIGNLYYQRGEMAQAINVLERTLAGREEIGHPDLDKDRAKLARWLSELGERDA